MKFNEAMSIEIDELSRVLDDDLPDAMDKACCELADRFGINDTEVVWEEMHDIMMGRV